MWSPTGTPEPDAPVGVAVLPRVFGPRAEQWMELMPRTDSSASDPQLWDFLAALAIAQNVDVIVEAGTYRGNACFAMAEALRLGGREAMIYTADVVDYHITEPLRTMGLEQFVDLYVGRFEQMLDERVPGLIDLAFVDASDENPWLRLEYVNLLVPRMAPHGLIVVDDCTDDAWPGAKILRDHACVYLPLGRGTCLFQSKATP